MAKLTLSDLKSQGLELTKDEAQELAPLIREVSHTGDLSANTVYEGDDNETGDAWFKGGDAKNNSEDKLIWEHNLGPEGWCTLAPENLDEFGNLKGSALELFEFMKSQPDSERGDCTSYWFRQTPESQIGQGDSTGKVKILRSIDDEVLPTAKKSQSADQNVTETDNSVTETEATTDENAADQTGEAGDPTGATLDEKADNKAEHRKTKAKRLKEAGLIE